LVVDIARSEWEPVTVIDSGKEDSGKEKGGN